MRESRTLGSVRGVPGNVHPYRAQASLRRAISEFVAHYHTERNHQGLANRLICPQPHELASSGTIYRSQRLGGMLNYYYSAAA